MRRSSSIRRPALFQESPKAKNNPRGELHLASEEDLQKTIRKHGAVSLIRQLAQDLADRDDEISLIQRCAQERERELKKMLQEMEVANSTIDERLRKAVKRMASTNSLQDTRPRTDRTTVGGLLISSTDGSGIDEMMGEAMRDNVGTITESEEEGGSTFPSRDLSRKSSHTTMSGQKHDYTLKRGWKNYFFSGDASDTKVRASGSARRKGLDDDLFNPIRRTSTTPASHDRTRDPSVQSRKSSNSVTSWTIKLFGGNQGGQGTVRGRSSTTGSNNNTNTSTALSKDSSSARAALMRVSSKDAMRRTPNKTVPPLPLNPGTTGLIRKQPAYGTGPISPKPPSNGNLGPVEMESILPPESRPPTDQLYKLGNPNNYLTDRFGFIYDGRRRRREAQAATAIKGQTSSKKPTASMHSRRESLHASSDATSSHSRTSSISRPLSPTSAENVNSSPQKGWQDYLKVATHSTELLSHTPVAHHLTILSNGDQPESSKKSPTFSGARSMPTTSLNLETASTPRKEQSGIRENEDVNVDEPLHKSEIEPVKLLLEQLTEIHDTLQHQRSIKWNEFLRKVRAEWQKEGVSKFTNDDDRLKTLSATPEASLIDGSLIGISNFGNKGKVGRAKWKEFKALVLAGVPVAYRSKIWSECCGASTMQIPEYYAELQDQHSMTTGEKTPEDPSILAQIEMDIHRTMTDNVFFRSGPGVSKLKDVLLAYSRRNPHVGYCQGMNNIAASLLLIMPTPEGAFWMLCAIIEQILPSGYFAPPLLASRADSMVLRGYVRDILPTLSAHLETLNIDLEALTFQWFLSLLTDCLSAEALFRVWDVVFCTCSTEGSTFLFQIALALLKLNEKDLLQCQTPGDVYWYLGNRVTDHAVGIDGLIGASEGLGKVVKKAEVDIRRVDAMKELQQQMEGNGDRGESEHSNGLTMQEPRPVKD